MARAALKWEVRGLAGAANVSTSTIVRLERGEALLLRTVDAIRATLEAKGVEVRLRVLDERSAHSHLQGPVAYNHTAKGRLVIANSMEISVREGAAFLAPA
jgi:transcriptional regulator with XRE-family HTH domain